MIIPNLATTWKWMILIGSLTISAHLMMSQELIDRRQIKNGIWKGHQIEYADRLIALKLRQGVSTAELNDIVGRFAATLFTPPNELRWAVLELPEGQDIFSILSALGGIHSIEAVEPDLVGHTTGDPNDPYFSLQWGFKNTGSDPPGTPNADIHLSWARDISLGRGYSGNVLISIFDSGISLVNGELSHPDLNNASRIILGECSTGEGRGVVDGRGHGTHVAGIAGAETDNSVGVAGVAPSAELLIAKVVNGFGQFQDSWFQNAVIYAINRAINLDVPLVAINFSAGHSSGSNQLVDAVTYAANHNVLIVSTTGNDARADGIHYPAGYSSTYSNVIAVGATDPYDYRTWYSNYGQTNLVRIVAPGGAYSANIYSTIPTYATLDFGSQTYYGYDNGTSMAAPTVTATAALVGCVTMNSPLSPGQVRTIIEQSADATPAMGAPPDSQYGWGRLNVYKALKHTIEHYSTTIGGAGATVVLHENFTTLNGTTLTIAPGTTIQMDPGVVLYINGQLIANGNSSQPITLDRSGTSGSWNSLAFASGSSGTINYCTFNHASTAVTSYSSNVTISNSTFTNCTGGITCRGASPSINGCVFTNNYFGIYLVSNSAPDIENCDIEYNGNSGIYLSSSAPILRYNTIRNSTNAGIWFHSFSSPSNIYHNNISGPSSGFYCDQQSSPHAIYGSNAISTSGMCVPVYAYYGCLPDFGDPSNYGLNSFLNSPAGGYVTALSSSTVSAVYNWWGTSSPNPNYFGHDGTSSVIWSPPDPTNPNPGRPKVDTQNPIVATGPFADSTFTLAYQASLGGKYSDAIALFLKVYQFNASTPSLAKQALLFLADAYDRSGQTDFLTYLSSNLA